MSSLKTCSSCQGFVPIAMDTCPNCNASISTRSFLKGPLKAMGTVFLGSAMAMTLSACYGSPVMTPLDCESAGCPEATCQADEADLDQDGFCGAFDCDDDDPNVHVYADDIPGDGIDQDCDGND